MTRPGATAQHQRRSTLRDIAAHHEAQARWHERRAQEADAQRKTLTFRRMLSRGHQHEKWAETIERLIETASETNHTHAKEEPC